MPRELARQAALEEGHQLALLLLVRTPQLGVVQRAQAVERIGAIEVHAERHADGLLDDAPHGPTEPGRDVDPVGDGTDRVAGQLAPGLVGRLAMQP